MSRHTCVICRRKREKKYMLKFKTLKIDIFNSYEVKSFSCTECLKKVIDKMSVQEGLIKKNKLKLMSTQEDTNNI